LQDELNIGRTGLGLIIIKYGKVIINFKTGWINANIDLVRRASVFFS
jgi:hypothetical protein